MGKESNLWQRLKRNTQEFVVWDRIENASGSGFPDTVGVCRGEMFALELKVVNGKSLYFQPSQIAWMTRNVKTGRNSLILAGYPDLSVSILAYPNEPQKFKSGNKIRIPIAEFKNLRYYEHPIEWRDLLSTITSNIRQ